MYNLNHQTNYLTQQHIEALDALMTNNYEFRYGFEQLIKGMTNAINNKEAAINALKKEQAAIIEKYENIINIKKLTQPKLFQLRTFNINPADYASIPLTIVEKTYDEDLLVADQNEIIINDNTKVIDNVVKTMELSGIAKSVTKFKSARSSTKITVDAEWYAELKREFISNYNPAATNYRKTTLVSLRINLVSAINKANEDKAKLLREKSIQEERQAKFEKEKQQEAIIIAHTCINFKLDPLKITSRNELDKALIEMGHVPDSVINALKQELNLA